MADSGTEIVRGDLLSVVKDDCSLTEAISEEGGLTPGSSVAKESHKAEPLDREDSTKVPSVKTQIMEAEGSDKHSGTALTPAATCAAMSENGTTEEAQSTPQSQTLTEVNGESSEAMFGRSDENSQSATSDSPSSIRSLEFFEGNTGNDEPLSSYSALGNEGRSPSADVPGLVSDVLAAAATGGATAAPDPEPMMPAYYFVKWITWKEKKTPIITQSENGPCPLLAIMNTLFLRWKVMLDCRNSYIGLMGSMITHLNCIKWL